MDLVETLAIIVFSLVFIAFAVHKTPWFEIKRSYVAIVGALLMLIIGALSIEQAFDSIKFDVIFLLLGMMCLVAGLEYTGFFTLVSDILLKHSKTKFRLLCLIMFVSAFLTMIMLNDAIALMFTPIVIRCCMKINTNPIPYLFGMMISINIGSIATAIGNPQNAFIASHAGIDFITFIQYCLPISLLCLVAVFVLVWLVFRKQMSKPFEYETALEDTERKIDKRMWVMIAITVITFLFFMLSGPFKIPNWEIALISGAISLIVVMTSKPKDILWVAKRIDWHILLFFAGLFVIVGGVINTGFIQTIVSIFPGFGVDETPTIANVTLISVILSNLVSNMPAVVIISHLLPVNDISLWMTLAASSTIAGNTTLLGSAVNIIVAEKAEKSKIEIGYFKFLPIGILATVVTLIIMFVVIMLYLN